jgi:hypothetical protein
VGGNVRFFGKQVKRGSAHWEPRWGYCTVIWRDQKSEGRRCVGTGFIDGGLQCWDYHGWNERNSWSRVNIGLEGVSQNMTSTRATTLRTHSRECRFSRCRLRPEHECVCLVFKNMCGLRTSVTVHSHIRNPSSCKREKYG